MPPEPFVVTGAAGFIGSNVARLLLERGEAVVGVDDLNDAYDPRLKQWRLDRLLGRPGFSFAKADVRAPQALQAALPSGAQGVFHLAARAGVRQSQEDPTTYLQTNGIGTLNVLDWCRRHDVQRLLVASTSSLYGAHNPRPFREDADTSRPLSPYAASKAAAESMAAAYAHLHGLDVAVPRYFTVYGPAGRPDMSVFRFVRWIAEGEPLALHGDGTQERDFTHVDDIARGTLACLERNRGFQVYNLGSDRPVALNHLIAAIEAETGCKARVERRPLLKADVPKTWADITKARKSLGWEPKVSFEDGVRSCVRWYAENRDWAKDLPLGAA